MSRYLTEWRANRGRVQIQVALLLLRVAQDARGRLGRRHPLALLVGALYRAYAQSVCGIDIPIRTVIGEGLTIFHGFGVVINADAVLGSRVVLRHGVTIGNVSDAAEHEAPVIGDDVVFGAGASVLGAVRVGDGAMVGAHALVLGDVPPGARVRAEPTVARAAKEAP